LASEVHKLFDESVGQIKRVEHTAERLKDAETQFEQDQKSIDEVNTSIIITIREIVLVDREYYTKYIMLDTTTNLCVFLREF